MAPQTGCVSESLGTHAPKYRKLSKPQSPLNACSGDMNRDLYDIHNESLFTPVVNKIKYSLPFSPMPSPQSSLLPGHGNCVLCSEMRPSYLSGYPGERNLDSSRMSHSVSHNSFGLQVGSLRLQKAGFFH